MLEAIIFDMDGVLIDSPGYISTSFNAVLKEHGIFLDKHRRKMELGLSLRDQIRRWNAELSPRKKINYHEFSARANKIQLKIMKDALKPDKSIHRLLDSARKKGIKLAVATASGSVRAHKILTLIKVKKKLGVIVTSDDVQKHKPNPAVFLKAAKKLGVKPQNCVVFEDALNGVEAALRANMVVVALLTDHNHKKDFENKADLIIKNFSEISIPKIEELMEKRPNSFIRRLR